MTKSKSDEVNGSGKDKVNKEETEQTVNNQENSQKHDTPLKHDKQEKHDNHEVVNKYIKRINVEKVIQLKEPKYFFNYEKEDKFIEKFYVCKFTLI